MAMWMAVSPSHNSRLQPVPEVMKDQAITARKNMSQSDGLSQALNPRVRGATNGAVSRVAEPMGSVETEVSSYFYRPGVAGSLGDRARLSRQLR